MKIERNDGLCVHIMEQQCMKCERSKEKEEGK